MSESSKVDRRRFLKYACAGLAAAGVGVVGYYYAPSLYEEYLKTKPALTTTTTALTATPPPTSTTATVSKGEWWKYAKVATASLDYWTLEGKKYAHDAGIEVIDWLACGAMTFTPAMIWRQGVKEIVDDVHSAGLMTRSGENLMGTQYGDFVIAPNGLIYPNGQAGGERIRYPLKALYQSQYWSNYFGEKWRNPDGSNMQDPIEGGCARNLQNQVIEFPDWSFSLMSIHNPYYLDYVNKCLEMDVDVGFDGVNLDNINCTAFGFWQGGDFSPWAEHRFREYLSKTYSQKQLSAMGVRNLDQFSLRKYLLNRGYFNNVNMDDPIVKSWSRFEHEAFDAFIRAIYDHAKTYAQSKGNYWFAISGNIYNLRGWPSPFTVLGAKSFDVIWLEENDQFVPPARISLVTKQGWALSKSRKPVWQHLCAETPELGKYLRNDHANLLGIICAEVYSVAGVYLADRLYYIGLTEQTLYPMGPKSTALIRLYCRFMRANEQFLLDVRPCRPQVAIAYSLPTMMMGFYPSLGWVRSWESDRGIMGISHVLDREHIPFDFIILGHPQFWDDSEALAALPDYDVLVLSNAEALSDEQVAAIRSFVERGGSLLSFGAIATRDVDYNKRKTAALQDLAEPGLNKVGDGKARHLSGNPGFSYWKHVIDERREDAPNYKTIRDAVMSLSTRPRIIETNAPDTVSINILQQGNRSVQVHFVNLEYNEEDDSIPEKDGLRIKVKVPSGFSFDGKEAALMTPDGNVSPQRLEYSLLEGYVELEVPHLRIYSIAAIYDPHL
jgi:hypothetical protein